jgi:hypothetical protein
LDDDDPVAVDTMLRWMYDGDYLDNVHDRKGQGDLTFHANVAELAEKYGLPGLAREARDKVDSFFKYNEFRYNGFQPNIQGVFGCEQDTAAYDYIEKAILKWFCEKRPTLHEFIDYDELSAVLEDNPRFTSMLVVKMLEKED